MKQILGFMCYGVGLAFSVGLMFGMLRLAGNAKSEVNGLIVFFGFSIPMTLLGVGAGVLWMESKGLIKFLGWNSTFLGLIWALLLLYHLSGWVGFVGGVRKVGFFEGVCLFFGFGIPMLFCGGSGISMLIELPNKDSQFAVCVRSEDYPASLKVRRVYEMIPDLEAAKHRLVRIVDESGEDDLYPEDCFVPIEYHKLLRFFS